MTSTRPAARAAYRSIAQHRSDNLRLAALAIVASLAIGVAGFMGLMDMAWPDAVLNASMLLGGMGPVFDTTRPIGTAGKLFASFYALYAGIIFLVVAGLFLAPLFRDVLLRHHLALEHEKQIAD